MPGLEHTENPMRQSADLPQRGVRAPVQDRSKESWERILQAGLDILLEEGRGAVTIQAISARAGVAPTALYSARVTASSHRPGTVRPRFIPLIESVTRSFEDAAFSTDPGTSERTSAVVHAIARMFDDHIDFLRTPSSPRPRWTPCCVSVASRTAGRPLVETMTELLATDDVGAARDVARMLMAEGTYRAFFGSDFLTARPESLADFSNRLDAMAWARLSAGATRRSRLSALSDT